MVGIVYWSVYLLGAGGGTGQLEGGPGRGEEAKHGPAQQEPQVTAKVAGEQI